jgi:hypothetical protein
MSVSRLVSLAAAIVISGIQWTAFFNPVLHTQSVQVVDARVAGESSDGSLPVVVVRAYRQPWWTL